MDGVPKSRCVLQVDEIICLITYLNNKKVVHRGKNNIYSNRDFPRTGDHS